MIISASAGCDCQERACREQELANALSPRFRKERTAAWKAWPMLEGTSLGAFRLQEASNPLANGDGLGVRMEGVFGL